MQAFGWVVLTDQAIPAGSAPVTVAQLLKAPLPPLVEITK
jgi:hypothetical protein